MKIYRRLSEDPNFQGFEAEKQFFLNLGYPDNVIDEAFKFALEKFNEPEKPKNIRYLHADETHLFTNDAYGLLINLQMTGVIEPRIVEIILTRAIVLQSDKVDVDEVKQLVNFILMNPENRGHRLAFDLLTYQEPDGRHN